MAKKAASDVRAPGVPRVFDRPAMRRAKTRAAARPEFADSGFLFDQIGAGLADRLGDINRRFERALLIGRGLGSLAASDQITAIHTAAAFPVADGSAEAVIDEEWLPYGEGSFDLIVANLTLHWVNDLPGALVQFNGALRPDGLLLVSLFGGDTLAELRSALMTAELELAGGVHPRVSPFAEVRELGALLQRVGFALPVADSERVTVTYADFGRLLDDLKGMGETNAVVERARGFARRDLFARAGAIYADQYADAEGRLPATFEIHTLTGWAPAPGQPRPKRPGSATARLAAALGAEEVSTGVKVGE